MNQVLNHAIYRIQKIAQQAAAPAPGGGIMGNPLTTGAMALGAMSGDSLAERGIGAGAGYMLANAVQQYLQMTPAQRAQFFQNNPQQAQVVADAAAKGSPASGPITPEMTNRQKKNIARKERRRLAAEARAKAGGGTTGSPAVAPGAPAPTPAAPAAAAPGGASPATAAATGGAAPAATAKPPAQISRSEAFYNMRQQAGKSVPWTDKMLNLVNKPDPTSARGARLENYKNEMASIKAGEKATGVYDSASRNRRIAGRTGGSIGAVGGAMLGNALGDELGVGEGLGTVLGGIGGGVIGNKAIGGLINRGLSRTGAGSGVDMLGNQLTKTKSPFSMKSGLGRAGLVGSGILGAGLLANKFFGGGSKKSKAAPDPEDSRLSAQEFDDVARFAGYEKVPDRSSFSRG